MKSLIMAIVQTLVDKPAEVQIKEVIGEHAHVLELRVAKEDLGKVIGKGGAHASAIRTIMAATSGKEKKRYTLAGVIDHSQARLLVVDERLLPEVERVRARLRHVSDENLLVLRTRGAA